MKKAKEPKKAKKQAGDGVCVVCRTPFFYHSVRIPTTCGLLYCRAIDEWGPAEWEGAADMARQRWTGVRKIKTARFIRDGLVWKCDCKGLEDMTKNHAGDTTWTLYEEEFIVELSPLDKEALRRYPNAG